MEGQRRFWEPRTFEIPTGTCLFCGQGLKAKGGRTKEHAIPRWLLRHFDIEGQLIEGAWMSAADGYKAKDTRPQVLGSLVQGSVCADCNGGWMSTLERDVQPLLLALADGNRSVARLGNSERLLLSRWAVKTCAALNHASNFHRLVRPLQAGAVESGPPVEGTFVFAGQLPDNPTDPIYWTQSVGAGPMVVPPDTDLDEVLIDLQEGWRITLLVGRLLLLTTYVPPGQWQPLANSATHTLIWPLDMLVPVEIDRAPVERKSVRQEPLLFNMELRMVHESLAGRYSTVRIPVEVAEVVPT
jgi:hypothetical protein